MRGSQFIEVIKTTVLEGAGENGDSMRLVIYYHTKEGELLAIVDEEGEE